MSRMIRCIEGHVFDSEKHDKCPSCGWVPKKTDKKPRHARQDGDLSFGQRVTSIFGAMTSAVENALGMVGIKDKPGLAAGIVYAGMILLLVTGASALPGSRIWPGNWSKSSTEANLPSAGIEKRDTKNKENEKSVSVPDVTPAPLPSSPPAPAEPEKSPGKKSADASGDDSAPLPEKKRRRQQYQQPQIHVPHEMRRLLHRIF